MKRLGLLTLAFVIVSLGGSVPAFSQGCALCYTQAAGGSARFIEALRSGILILVIPPMLMSVGISVIAYRKRNRFSHDDSRSERDW
jgi:cbb3-type cytochrome oxidase subunit 3